MRVDRRTQARELAMQALYQLDVQGAEILRHLKTGFFRESNAEGYIQTLAMEWTQGTWDHLEDADKLISESIIRWQFSRLSPVDKSILRLSVYQLLHCQDIPPKVVINEAIELAKKYSTDKSPGFVNGVLDAVLRRNDEKQEGNEEVTNTTIDPQAEPNL